LRSRAIIMVGIVLFDRLTAPGVTPNEQTTSAGLLKFFVRSEVDGLRVTNDTDSVQVGCEVTIGGGYSRTETFLKHEPEILPYQSFQRSPPLAELRAEREPEPTE
jgi:hypothetical protein